MRILEEGAEAAAAGFALEESIAATDDAAAAAADATPAASSPATSTVIGWGLEEAEEEEEEEEEAAAALLSSCEAAATAESVAGLSCPDECSARTRAPWPLGGTEEDAIAAAVCARGSLYIFFWARARVSRGGGPEEREREGRKSNWARLVGVSFFRGRPSMLSRGKRVSSQRPRATAFAQTFRR